MLFFPAALGMAIAVSGCATALNVQDNDLRKPYGGFTMPVEDFFGGGPGGERGAILFWPLWLLDKPLSLVGDTLTLPLTLCGRQDTWVLQKGQNAGMPPAPPPPGETNPVRGGGPR